MRKSYKEGTGKDVALTVDEQDYLPVEGYVLYVSYVVTKREKKKKGRP